MGWANTRDGFQEGGLHRSNGQHFDLHCWNRFYKLGNTCIKFSSSKHPGPKKYNNRPWMNSFSKRSSFHTYNISTDCWISSQSILLNILKHLIYNFPIVNKKSSLQNLFSACSKLTPCMINCMRCFFLTSLFSISQ